MTRIANLALITLNKVRERERGANLPLILLTLHIVHIDHYASVTEMQTNATSSKILKRLPTMHQKIFIIKSFNKIKFVSIIREKMLKRASAVVF